MNDRNCGYDRKTKKRESPPDLILIITEGEKTEPNYFKKFRVFPKEVVEVQGVGRNTKKLHKNFVFRISLLQSKTNCF